MSETLVEACALTKCHRLWRRPSDRLIAGLLLRISGWARLPSALRRYLTHAVERRGPEFHALCDVSFQLRRGESLGIIGRNGSGKSTLLQILAGTLTPTSGSVVVRGQVAALLELGSGFNPEFSGRENVLIQAALSGLSRRQALERFSEVTAFAGIGEFIEQPVKVYSSGMMVRLAFATQTVLNPQLFIVDEALAVGDVFFQARCAGFFREKLSAGMSLILVSHDLPSVKALCSKSIVLHAGRIAFYGPSEEAVNFYHHLHSAGSNLTGSSELPVKTETGAHFLPVGALERNWESTDEVGTRECEIVWVRSLDASGNVCRDFRLGEQVRIELYVRSHFEIPAVNLAIEVVDRHNHVVYGASSLHLGMPSQSFEAGGEYRFSVEFSARLGQGSYLVDLALGLGDRGDGAPTRLLHRVDKITSFSVRHGPVPAFFGLVDLAVKINAAPP